MPHSTPSAAKRSAQPVRSVVPSRTHRLQRVFKFTKHDPMLEHMLAGHPMQLQSQPRQGTKLHPSTMRFQTIIGTSKQIPRHPNITEHAAPNPSTIHAIAYAISLPTKMRIVAQILKIGDPTQTASAPVTHAAHMPIIPDVPKRPIRPPRPLPPRMPPSPRLPQRPVKPLTPQRPARTPQRPARPLPPSIPQRPLPPRMPQRPLPPRRPEIPQRPRTAPITLDIGAHIVVYTRFNSAPIIPTPSPARAIVCAGIPASTPAAAPVPAPTCALAPVTALCCARTPGRNAAATSAAMKRAQPVHPST